MISRMHSIGYICFIIILLGINQVSANNLRTPSFFLKKKLVIILPKINTANSTINPFNAIQEWNRYQPQNALDQATLSIIKSELKLHLEPYFANGIVFKDSIPKTETPALRLILLNPNQFHNYAWYSKFRRHMHKLGLQGYGIFCFDDDIFIIAHKPVGLLYGAYGFLEILGFRWYAPDKLWQIRPERLTFNEHNLPEFSTPKVRWRGFWTWNSTIDDDFLFWLARNRFNLIGDGSYNIDLAKALGIKIWGGGHNVISFLLNPKQICKDSKEMLGLQHPDWYGLPDDVSPSWLSKLRWKENVYLNPCILNKDLIDYFAIRLAEELKSGKYANVDILNLWLSDTKPSIFPHNCPKRALYTNPTDAIFQFYYAVIKQLNKIFKNIDTMSPIYIAGASYYSSWQMPSVKDLFSINQGPSLVRYIHLFYLNERSYATDLFQKDNPSSINRKIATRFKRWLKWLKRNKITFGTVDYFNYSIYLAMPKIYLKAMNDLEQIVKHDSKLVSYMHIVGNNMGPKRLLHRLLSIISWSGQVDINVLKREYYELLYGHQSYQVEKAYDLLDQGLDNIYEILGPSSSLNLYLNQNKYWRSPPLKKAEVKKAVMKLLQGGDIELPIIYKTWPYLPKILTTTRGLCDSVYMLKSAEEKIKLSSIDSNDLVKARLQKDIIWVTYARRIYQTLEIRANDVIDDRKNRKKNDIIMFNRLKKELNSFPFYSLTISNIHHKRIMNQILGFK